VDDYAIAYRLAREILGFSLDDLKKHARDLLDQIQEMVKRESRATGQIEAEISFTRRQIREFTSWPDYQIKTYIRQLRLGISDPATSQDARPIRIPAQRPEPA
jgi:DNA primase